MANYCNFEIRIKGKRGNSLLLCHSIATMEGKSISYARGTDDAYEVCLCGNCKWSVNFDVTDDWNGQEIDTDLNALPEALLADIASDFYGYSLRAKSRVLECEVLSHYWSAETGFDYFDHFINGRRVKKHRYAYDPDNTFDWETLEYTSHADEIDEDEDPEASSLLFANRFVRHFDASACLAVLQDQEGDEVETISAEELNEKLAELRSLLKDLTGEDFDSDDEEAEEETEEETEDEDDDDDGSVTETLDVKEFWVAPSVQFILPTGFVIEKKTRADGTISYSINGGLNGDPKHKFYLFSAFFDVTDIEPKKQKLSLEELALSDPNEKNIRKIYTNGETPSLLHSQKMDTQELLGVELRMLFTGLAFRFDKNKLFSSSVVSQRMPGYDKRYFYDMLWKYINGFRIHGKPLNCAALSINRLYNELEPLRGDEPHSEIRFDENKRISAKEWSVCLPLGFCKTKSKALENTCRGKTVLVPETHAYADSEKAIPVVIAIDNEVGNLNIEGGWDYIDQSSKDGLVRVVGKNFAEHERESSGLPYQFMTINHDKVGVCVLGVGAQDIAAVKCILLTHECACRLTAVFSMEGANAVASMREVGHWLSTFEFTHSMWLPSPILIEKPECLEKTLQGDYDKFDEAFVQLFDQYGKAAGGSITYLRYQQSLPGMTIDMMKQNIVPLLSDAFKTKALGVKAADAFVEKLKQNNASEAVLKYVYNKLTDLDVAYDYFKIELADDEEDNDGSGIKVTTFAMHDDQIVNVNEPLSIKGTIAKWKQAAGMAVSSEPNMSSLLLNLARSSQEREDKRSELLKHVETDPVIIIPGKKFVFTGFGMSGSEKDHPLVNAVVAKGGLLRDKVSGVTDYLVVNPEEMGESKIKAAVEQQQKGKPIKIVLVDALEAALNSGGQTPAPTASAQAKVSQPQAPALAPTIDTTTKEIIIYNKHFVLVPAEKVHETIWNSQLGICDGKRDQTVTSETDYVVVDEGMENDERVLAAIEGAKAGWKVKLISGNVLRNSYWAKSDRLDEYNPLPDDLYYYNYNLVDPTRRFIFTSPPPKVLVDALRRSGCKIEDEMYDFEFHNVVIALDEQDNFKIQRYFKGYENWSFFLNFVRLHDLAEQLGISVDELDRSPRVPLSECCEPDSSSNTSQNSNTTRSTTSSQSSYRPSQSSASRQTEDVTPPKKEGCYIATAVYGSYDAPQVLTLRRFRDETLRRTALGRLFIRVYYRLSPSVAQRLKNATAVNTLVRKALDRWVRRLDQKADRQK